MRRGEEVCWDCCKGRHSLCTGRAEPEWPDQDEDQGPTCECPVDHADPRSASTTESGIPDCLPIWVYPGGYYVSPLEAPSTGT